MFKSILFFLLNTALLFGQNSETELVWLKEYITKKSLMQKVEILASPEFAGRLPGHSRFDKASEFAKEHFINLNLTPAFGNDYYQRLFVEYNDIKSPAQLCLVRNDEIVKEYRIGSDYAFRGFTGSGNFTAPVVFCGYGLSTNAYDDYAHIDVKGKVVLVFKQNPSWKIEGVEFGFGYPREKAKIAFDKGAVGLIMVSRPLDNKPQPVIGSVMDGEGEHNQKFPQLHISIDAANDFLKGTAFTLADLQQRIDESKKPHSFELNSSALINVNTEYYKKRETQNIAAILHGSDDKLKNEYIIIGAHLDHVGSQAGEVYYPGANDNASGSAGVMQLAEAFIKSGIKPKRSIVFTLFSAEEQGLKGAEHFVAQSPIDLNKIVAMINMDCIGYGDSIQIGNGNSAPVLWNMFQTVDSGNNNLMMERTWSGGGADATPFHNKGIPSVYVVSYYSYDHLHLPSDLPETLNQNLFQSIVTLVAEVLYKLADEQYLREQLAE